jgi:hypothetical protein
LKQRSSTTRKYLGTVNIGLTPILTMPQMDAKIAELVARLTALERERTQITAEINTPRSAVPSLHDPKLVDCELG